MNRFVIASLVAIAAAAASPAFADDITIDTTPFASSRTRADVQAELVRFKQGVNPWSQTYNQLGGFQGARTRAEVTAEFLNAREAVEAYTSEDSGSAYLNARVRIGAPVIAGQPAAAAE